MAMRLDAPGPASRIDTSIRVLHGTTVVCLLWEHLPRYGAYTFEYYA